MILDGKVALITGAGSGIGADSARLFAREGAKVGILSRTTEEVTQVADTIRSSGGETLPLTADISKPQEIQSAINRLVERWGRLDIVFANAGINGVWAPLDELSVEDWERTIRINLTGTFLTLKYSFPYMKENGGAMLVTSSVNGTRIFSNTGATAYSATKAAQVAVTKMLAVELAKNRIRVNVICPGAIKTEIGENTEQRDVEAVSEPVIYPQGKIPLTDGEPGSAGQVAQLALFLVSDRASHITGTEVWIDGAESLIVG